MSNIEQIINEYNSLGINQQLDYDKFYLYSIITHSTAIEGSTVTEIENQLLFDKGISANKPMAEQLMNMIQKEVGIIPSIVKKENRAEYIQSLALSQDSEDSTQFIVFMMESHKQNLLQQIEEYKTSLQNDSLKSVNDSLNINDDSLKFTKTEQKILKQISKNPKVTIIELMDLIKVSEPTVNRTLKSLKQKGVLERVGAKKDGSWKVKKER